MSIYIYTLAFNLFSEVQKATERLYRQNEKNFHHIILDLGFPLINGNEIPQNIEEAQEQNSESLKALCARFGSGYLKAKNEGVSQNTTTVYKHINPTDEDMLISCEPDEIQVEGGWVDALANVIKGGLAYCAPRLTEHEDLLARSPHAKLKVIGGEEVYVMSGTLNYGQIAYNCGFLNKFGGIPFPAEAPIYGYLEHVLVRMINESGMEWGLLKNFTTDHTDYEKGTVGASKLLRQWKNDSIFYRIKTGGKQIPFEEWLGLKQKELV